jgi:uncharacterized iron-regulated membrane protein
MRFWARALSVMCPLDLALVVGVVLELRAHNPPDKIRVETKRTRRRSRNVMEVTATWVTLGFLFFFIMFNTIFGRFLSDLSSPVAPARK